MNDYRSCSHNQRDYKGARTANAANAWAVILYTAMKQSTELDVNCLCLHYTAYHSIIIMHTQGRCA